MKKAIVISIISFLSTLSFGQNCSKLKEGSWKVTDENDKSLTTYLTREGDYQIEHTPSLGLKLKTKIIWISDCSYSLSVEKALENKLEIVSIKNHFKAKIIFSIIEQTENYFIAKGIMKGKKDFDIEIKYIKN